MRKYFVWVLISLLAIGANAQESAVAPKTDSVSLDLAKTALKAHGGEKFKNMKTLVVRGTTDISGAFPQSLPAGFAMIIAGEKYRLEISSPVQSFKQIYDGAQTFSSINGFSLPPINRLGLPLLQRLGEEGFNVSDLPETAKKKKGFRITSPEGYYTDFFVDEKNGNVKAYEASYDVNGRKVTTSVEIDKNRTVEGVIVPETYSQRFDLGNLTIYSAFKAREIVINSEISNDVFVMN